MARLNLEHKIQFVIEGTRSDGYGGTIPDKSIVESTYAKIEQLSQSRNLEQVHLGLPSAFRVEILNRKGFKPDVRMLVKWRGEYYRIITTPVINHTRMMQTLTFDIA